MKWCVGLGIPLFFVSDAASAAVITPTQAFASSYYSSSQNPVNLINNSGLNTSSGNVLTYTHSSDGSANNMWHAGQGQGIGGSAPVVANQYVVFDLGGNYNLSSAYLWQMLQSGLLGRGIKGFELYASSNAPSSANASNPPATYDLTGFTQILAPSTLAQGSGTSTPTQNFALSSATNVRQVYLKINSDWNGATSDYVGLSEIKFEGTLISAALYGWVNAAGGPWQTAGNWSPAGGPPTANDDVSFALNNTYAVTSGANVAVRNMNVSAGNPKLSIGSTALQASTINLSGGKLSVPSLVSGTAAAGQVGYSSAFNFTDGSLEIVGGAYRPATATFTSVTPNETISRTASWAISGAAGTTASPTLELTGGATASNPSPSLVGAIIIGINGGKGAVKVSDPGSLLTCNQTTAQDPNTLYLGLGGTIIGGNYVRSEATATVSNQGIISGNSNVILGTDGASASANVDNGTLRSVSGNLILGWKRYDGNAGRDSQATVAVTNGGNLSGGIGVYVGSRGGTGTVTVDGAGSSIICTNSHLWVGYSQYLDSSGASGNGTLTLTNHASASSISVAIGTEGGVGVVNVDTGSTISANNGSLLVGYNSTSSNKPGQGTLNITAGGTVTSTFGAFIGNNFGSTGAVMISGAGSTLTANSGILVGGVGSGTLNILNGGTANSNGDVMYIGFNNNASYATTGVVGVDGASSNLNSSKDLSIGYLGNSGAASATGTLTVTNGGTVNGSANIEIGRAGGKGNVTVGKSDGSDTGVAKLSAVGNLNFGSDGGTAGATLTVNPKGLVEVGGNLGATPSAVPPTNALKINLAGGTIKTGTTNFADAAYLNWMSGTLWYTGGTGVDSRIGADDNATLTVPVGGLLKGAANLRGQLAVSGIVSPGDDHGTATFNIRNLSIGTSGATANQGEFAADIDFASNAADLLSVTGSVELTNAKLSLSLLDVPIGELATPLTFLLIANDGTDAVSGAFAAIDLGAFSTAQYSVDYAFSGTALNGAGTGNDVAITFSSVVVVPEPSTLLMTLLATAGPLMRQRRPTAAR